MTYFQALQDAMTLCAVQPHSLFVGQAVACEGTAMRKTLAHLPDDKLLEFPVAEDMQLGFCIGLSLAGMLPIAVYPRINFLLLATNQLVLHLDKLPLYSDYRPKVLIRTAIATPDPLDPGPQHLGDFSDGLRMMLDTVDLVHLTTPESVAPAYERAIDSERSTILIEHSSLYAS